MKTIQTSLKNHLLQIGFLVLLFQACVFTSKQVNEIPPQTLRPQMSLPTKVHLQSGALIVYPKGFQMTEQSIEGAGTWYDLTRTHNRPVETVSRDSVAFVEYYRNKVEGGPLIGGLLAPGLFLAAIQNEDIYKAFFGSCPTVYAPNDDGFALQAECFSYSIAPDLETDDLDRLQISKPIDGKISLNVRNEAWETHYINRMQLLMVEHPAAYEAFPLNRQFTQQKNNIVLFGEEVPILQATDQAGHDILDSISKRDDRWYQSDSSQVARLTEEVFKDWVEVQAEVPEKADSLVIALKFRNTLFHTVEFYDLVLGSQGIRALDWMGKDLANPLYRAHMLNWYQTYFGISVELWNGTSFEPVQFIDDTGPIAWRQVAFKLATPDTPLVRLRFKFLPDHIMLDWVGISLQTSNDFSVKEIPCTRTTDVTGKNRQTSAEWIQYDDRHYLVTQPADAYSLDFDVGKISTERATSFFLHSKGYYIEWIRRDWMSRDPNDPPVTFQLSAASISKAAQQWQTRKAQFEREFFNSKIATKTEHER